MRTRLPLGYRDRQTVGLVLGVLFATSLASVSAHVVRGLDQPTLATAFVSSPTSTTDSPVQVAWGAIDTQQRVACFYAANTSPARPDDGAWPRVTALGFELPGQLSGFTLLEPAGGDWTLLEGLQVQVQQNTLALDFAVIAPVNPVGRSVNGEPERLLGLPPGQAAQRLSGTRFCVAGPFPDGLSIEQILNGVVVRFQGIEPNGPSSELGIWDNPARTIPLFP